MAASINNFEFLINKYDKNYQELFSFFKENFILELSFLKTDLKKVNKCINNLLSKESIFPNSDLDNFICILSLRKTVRELSLDLREDPGIYIFESMGGTICERDSPDDSDVKEIYINLGFSDIFSLKDDEFYRRIKNDIYRAFPYVIESLSNSLYNSHFFCVVDDGYGGRIKKIYTERANNFYKRGIYEDQDYFKYNWSNFKYYKDKNDLYSLPFLYHSTGDQRLKEYSLQDYMNIVEEGISEQEVKDRLNQLYKQTKETLAWGK